MKLRAWYPLLDVSGDEADFGSLGAATVSGTVRGVAGRGGLQAHSFDGTDDYIDIPTPINFGAGTFCAWAQPANDSDNGTYVLRLYDNNRIYIRQRGTEWEARIDDGTNQTNLRGPLTPDEWNHLCISWFGGRMRFYVNGVLEESGRQDSTAGAASTSLIGASSTTGNNVFNGEICDVRIYGDAAYPDEVDQIYKQGAIDTTKPPDNNNGGVSYYTLDETSGSTANDSWGTNDGTTSGGVTLGANGIRDTAFSLDGTDDHVDIPDSADLSGLNNLTVAAWVKFDSLGGDDYVINKGAGSTGDREWNLSKPADDIPQFAVYDESAGAVSTQQASRAISAGEWYHIAGTYDGSTLAFYLNGSKENSKSESLVIEDLTASVTIGKSSVAASKYMPGDVDDVRIYNRALNPNEVHRLYRYGTRGTDLRTELIDQI